MRKHYTLFICLVLTAALSAQQLSNAGFENWTGGIPDGWSTTRSIVSNTALESRDTIAPYQGSAAIKITTGHAGSPIDTLSGFAHYGPAPADGYTEAFVPFPCHPDSLQFAYKYTSVGGDQGAVNVTFRGHSNFFIDHYSLPSSASYQLISIPFFNGNSPGFPDSMTLTFLSSYSFNIPVYHAGSTLWVDAVKFIYNNSANACSSANAIQPVGADISVRLYPNPAGQQVTLTANAASVGAQIEMYDLTGRVVYQGKVNGPTNTISTDRLEAGYYTLKVYNDEGAVIFLSKVSVAH